jgi:hypothetical protein
MPIYQNSIIYKLCHQNDLENENIYVGSTTNFRGRKNTHKSSCNNEKDKHYNSNLYQYIRDNGAWDEWQMIPIEVFPCNDKKELEVRERYHIELLKSKLNKNIPTRNDKEYREDNKEKIKERMCEWRKEYQKLTIVCDHCGCETNKNDLSRHKKTNKCKNYNITKE